MNGGQTDTQCSEEAPGTASILMSHELTWFPEEENFVGGGPLWLTHSHPGELAML